MDDFDAHNLSTPSPPHLSPSSLVMSGSATVRAVAVLKSNDISGTVTFEQDAKVRERSSKREIRRSHQDHRRI